MSARPRVLLLGAAGQLGTALRRAFADDAPMALDRSEADLSHPERLRAVVRDARPDVILNAAAYTAVDRAESEPELADRVNHLAVRVLAEEAERSGALLVHYSTDYVFDGSKAEPWVETDPTGPLNVYGETKLAGERAIGQTCGRHLILRTSWVYSADGHNFLRTMLRVGRERNVVRVVNDQWGAPTGADALAKTTISLLTRVPGDEADRVPDWAGTYHASCGGKTSWLGFAQAIFSLGVTTRSIGTCPEVVGIPSAEYASAAMRPRNSVLSNQKLADRFGLRLPEWNQALRDVFDTIAGKLDGC